MEICFTLNYIGFNLCGVILMKHFYKLYIGQYEKEGTPATWNLQAVVSKEMLKNQVLAIVPNLRYGMELYIVNDDGVKAYFRDGLDKVFK